MNIDLAAFRKRIESDLLQLQEDVRQAESSAATVVLDQSSVGRLSRMDAMQQQAMAQGIRGRLATQKRRLQAALARVEADSFGCCCQCGAELEPARLQADPTTVFCPECVAERELSERA